MSSVSSVIELLNQAGAHRYGGEAVNQLEHALQCEQLAQTEGAAPELVAAALLHDLGHLLSEAADDAAQAAVDDKHQFRAMHLLRRLFGSAVTEPIRLHVDAKRYLCRADAAYYEALSPASRASLELQGGIYSVAEARRFISQPFARDAARLRTWDDRAKTPGKVTPGLAHYEKLLARCVKR
jgi:phosphonate degradation associated HDIG domain protein